MQPRWGKVTNYCIVDIVHRVHGSDNIRAASRWAGEAHNHGHVVEINIRRQKQLLRHFKGMLSYIYGIYSKMLSMIFFPLNIPFFNFIAESQRFHPPSLRSVIPEKTTFIFIFFEYINGTSWFLHTFR
jgi:hypothetical protein